MHGTPTRFPNVENRTQVNSVHASALPSGSACGGLA